MTTMKPSVSVGDILHLNEPDYLYGTGILRLCITKIGVVQRLGGNDWLDLEGVTLRPDGMEAGWHGSESPTAARRGAGQCPAQGPSPTGDRPVMAVYRSAVAVAVLDQAQAELQRHLTTQRRGSWTAPVRASSKLPPATRPECPVRMSSSWTPAPGGDSAFGGPVLLRQRRFRV